MDSKLLHIFLKQPSFWIRLFLLNYIMWRAVFSSKSKTKIKTDKKANKTKQTSKQKPKAEQNKSKQNHPCRQALHRIDRPSFKTSLSTSCEHVCDIVVDDSFSLLGFTGWLCLASPSIFFRVGCHAASEVTQEGTRNGLVVLPAG